MIEEASISNIYLLHIESKDSFTLRYVGAHTRFQTIKIGVTLETLVMTPNSFIKRGNCPWRKINKYTMFGQTHTHSAFISRSQDLYLAPRQCELSR